MRKQKIIDDAKELVNRFLLCMPFKDVKLTSCDENPELIKQMELFSAKQCALVCAKECREWILNFDDGGKYYWDEMIAEIESLVV